MFKKLENFWYHYKWHTIIALFFVVVIVFCSVQMATKEEYDAYVTFIGNGGKITQTNYHDILNSLNDLADDYDSNETVSVCFNRETFLSDDSELPGMNINTNVTTFMQQYMYSDCYLYIMDPVLYNAYKDSGMFVALEKYTGKIPSEMLNDEMSIKLSSTNFSKLLGIDSIPKDSVIVLKTVPYVNSKRKTEKMTIDQENHIDLLKNIINLGVYDD